MEHEREDKRLVAQERKLYELAMQVEQSILTPEEAARRLIEYGKTLMQYYPIVPEDDSND